MCTLIVIVFLLFNSYNKKKDFSTPHPNASAVVTVNNLNVNEEEYLLHLNREIAMTYNHFYQNFGIENSPKFWNTPINNIKPINFLKKRTNAKVVETKVIHTLAQKYKVINNFNFKEFKLQWKEYNKSRKEAHDKGETIYGAIQTDMPAYYYYLLSNLKIRVKEKILKSDFNISESDLKQYYEKIKGDHFYYSEKINIKVFKFDYNLLSYQESKQKIEDIKKKIDNGEILNKALEKKYPPGVYLEKTIYDSIPIYGEDNPDEIIKKNAKDLKLNEHRIVKSQEGAYLIKLKSTSKKKYYSFEKVKDEVLYHYHTKKYTNFLKEQKKNAVFKINNKVYNAISDKTFLSF